MSYLYITENGSVMSIDGGYFVVTDKDGGIRRIPKETLESVALFGNISLTTPCVRELLEKGIPVSYFSAKGSYFGRLESTGHKNIHRLKSQIYCADNEEFSLAIAKKIIRAKINNQIVVLRRYLGKNTVLQNEINAMNICKNKILNCNSTDEIIGYEGTAAKAYFKALSQIINPEFAFKGRNRMPPRDPFNSMISLGYTLLMYEIYGEIENKSLTPYCGFIHKDHERHPTLASDLMEEWRAVIVDSTVLSMIQGREIKPDGFAYDEESGGCFLDKPTMRLFLTKYENKLRTLNSYIDDTNMSYRQSLWHQVNSLSRAVESGNPEEYKPVVIR